MDLDLSLVEKANEKYLAVADRIAYTLGNDEPMFDAIMSAWDAIESLMIQAGARDVYNNMIGVDALLAVNPEDVR